MLAAALALGVQWSTQAGIESGIATFQNRAHGTAADDWPRLAQESLALIVAPKRIDTDQDTVDFTGRAMSPGEVTLTVNGMPVTVAPDGSFRIRQQVPVGRSRLLLVVEGSYGDKAEHKVFVRRTAAPAQTTEYGAYHALVIGNDNYQHLTDLNMAVGDAHAVPCNPPLMPAVCPPFAVPYRSVNLTSIPATTNVVDSPGATLR